MTKMKTEQQEKRETKFWTETFPNLTKEQQKRMIFGIPEELVVDTSYYDQDVTRLQPETATLKATN